MDWEIDFETFAGLIMIRASGVVEAEGILEYVKAAVAHPGWRQGMPVLVDFRNIDTDGVEYSDIKRIAAMLAPYASTVGGLRAAVVVSRPQDYGLIKIWEVLAGEVFSAHEVCYTVGDALAFLHGGSGERPTDE
jgi:hypothetical protein